jgi:hypothetical protein
MLGLCGVSLVGCMTRALSPPDLNAIYSEAAQSHHEFRNPVIVIPGVLGSKLVDPQTGRSVWGVFDGGFLNPEKPKNTALVALPMELGSSLDQLQSPVVATGALDRLRIRVLGIPVESRAYAGILETLGAAGYRDQQLAESGAIDYGSDHFTCFQFPYDWRKSNVENAAALDRYIREKKEFVRKKHREMYGKERGDIKFDIVAHSMGGLIARYYLRYGNQGLPEDGTRPNLNWAGAKNVSRLIMVGTPNAGSVLAFEDLVHGKHFTPKWLGALGIVSIPSYSAAVMGTYPSIYELMPRVRHRAFVENQSGQNVDVYDVKLWDKYGWGPLAEDQDNDLQRILPEVASVEQRRKIAREHVAKCLSNAQRFHQALDRKSKPPEGLKISLMAGDSEQTKERVQLDLSTGGFEVTKYAAGDGTVLRSSALADERAGGSYQPKLQSPIDLHDVTFIFRDHMNITKDPMFSDNLLFRLLEE